MFSCFQIILRLTKHILEECDVVPEERKRNLLAFLDGKGKGEIFDKKGASIVNKVQLANLSESDNASEENLHDTAQPHQIIKKRKITDSHFFDTMTKGDQETGEKLLARAMYVSGCPLQLPENAHWKAFFKHLRPAWTPPTRHNVSNLLLDQEFDFMKKMIDEKVKNAVAITVQCDTWTNIRGEAIMNFLLSTPEVVYYDSVSIGTNRENAQYIHDELKSVIDEVDVNKVLAIITDNVSANVSAWELLSQTYRDKNISFYGCIGHIGQLLIKDFASLPPVVEAINCAATIVKEFKKSTKILLPIFVEIQKNNTEDTKKVTLKLPGKTRWGSNLRCLKSVFVNRVNLSRLAISEKAKGTLSQLTKQKILDENTWWMMEKIIDLLTPILDWITIWEGDGIRLSLVVHGLHEIGKKLKTYLNTAPLPFTLNQANELTAYLAKRIEMAIKPIHLAAYFLDPKFRAAILAQDNFDAGYKYILSIAGKFTNASKKELIEELADYYARAGFYGQDHVNETAELLHPVKWWQTIGDKRIISKIAIAILQAPATSAATERSFSVEGFIHSSKRNRLLRDRAMKISFIKFNTDLLSRTKKSKTSVFEEDYEEDDEDEGELLGEDQIPEAIVEEEIF